MPVRRFRSVEEMETEVWEAPDEPRLAAAIARVWSDARRMAPLRFPPGVYKHRSIEQQNEQDARWERDAPSAAR